MTGCRAYGAEEIRDAFRAEVAKRGLESKVEIRETGCHGFCARAPVIAIDPSGIFYQQLTPGDVPEIVSETIEQQENNRAAGLPSPPDRQENCGEGKDTVLRRADSERTQKLRHNRSEKHRPVYCEWRLCRPRKGASFHEPRWGGRGGKEIGTPRERRCRLPDRDEMELRKIGSR